ncbi:calcium-translocating P-type ATPase, PMCA-type [Candidatus Daviesbacteria bacterium]|nr:calcium-translocating P-type ATPase, PMCA-type [Candidatus Daviesbacteria bacterium]
MDKAYLKSPQDLAKELQTDLQKGLSSQEAADRIKKYGPNQLKEAPGKNPFVLFLEQFKDFLILILIGASLVSLALGENIDAFLIIGIVFLNAIVGFIQEWRAEKAIASLKKLVTSSVKVIREGKLMEIPSQELVPGDLVELEEGQKVAADIRLTQVSYLQTNEASLTGESTPINKKIDVLAGEIAVADQKNMVFSGTTVASGHGIGLVVSTGMQTQIGKVAGLVSSQQETETPMQQKLNRLAGVIGKVVLVIALMVALEEMFLGQQQILQALISGVALAVAAIPEGLPAVVTISLALGTRRLLSKKALIRNLPAAETLGSTDVICADKTGTLTEGTMKVREIYGEKQKVLEMAVLASNARLSDEKVIGDSTEGALVQYAEEFNINQDQLNIKYTRVQEVPFSSERKMMSVVVKNGNEYLVATKGATEVILSKCSNLSDKQKREILQKNDEMAKKTLRVLAIATRHLEDLENIEENLTFLGLVGMMDPPRKEVKEAIQTCKNAGVKVVMITGDHLLTAEAIAQELGITGEAITGVDLDKLSDEKFLSQVENIGIYARVNPEHKIKIIKALKEKGHQVAMTGDGVNDAPALKAADIGVAMGITGTDVAKEASDMVLLDDHFATVVEAVKEGRGIYENIRKFVNYLLSSNMMEVSVIFIALLLGWPLPLLPIHLLWINLVTDGLPAIALGVDPKRADIMNSPPGLFREEIANKKFIRTLFLISSIMTVAILGIFGFSKENLIHGQTMVFTAVVLYEMVRIVAIRSEYHLPLFSNKFLWLAMIISIGLQLILLYSPLNSLFKIQSLAIIDWVILLTLGAALLLVMRLTSKIKFG